MTSPRMSPKLFFISVVLLIFVTLSLTVAYSQKHVGPEALFQQALRANLTATGLICTTQQVSGSRTAKQSISLDLASKSQLHAYLTSVPRPGTTIGLEEIDVPAGSYVRYNSIQTTDKNADGTSPDFNDALHIWGKTTRDDTSPSLFGRTVLGDCVVPLAHLSSSQVSKLMPSLAKNTIFKTNFSTTHAEKLSGKSVRVYDVIVAPQPYIVFMKQVATAYGLKDLDAVKVAEYSQKSVEKMKFYIDTNSHHLMKISNAAWARTVTFTDFGNIPKVVAPTSFISGDALQQRLAAQ